MDVDPVEEEWDVYLSADLAEHLHLLQLPSPHHLQKLTTAKASTTLAAKLKPKAGIFEIDLPFDTQSLCFDAERAALFARNATGDANASASSSKLDHQRLRGTGIPAGETTFLTVGTLHDGIILLYFCRKGHPRPDRLERSPAGRPEPFGRCGHPEKDLGQKECHLCRRPNQARPGSVNHLCVGANQKERDRGAADGEAQLVCVPAAQNR